MSGHRLGGGKLGTRQGLGGFQLDFRSGHGLFHRLEGAGEGFRGENAAIPIEETEGLKFVGEEIPAPDPGQVLGELARLLA